MQSLLRRVASFGVRTSDLTRYKSVAERYDRYVQLKDADKFFRVAFMPCYGIFLAAKFSQIEAYAHADE